MKTQLLIILTLSSNLLLAQNFKLVGTNQSRAFNNATEITIPTENDGFYGQNANYPGNLPTYIDNGDGTISDLVTGLMWQKSPDYNNDGVINSNDKMTLQQAISAASVQSTGGYDDWRLPTIKELYSLILFSGYDVSSSNPSFYIPFIDTNFFDFAYGDQAAGERLIDAQYLSSTEYVSTTMLNSPTVFGVNFADGRIKGYGYVMPGGSQMDFYVKYVRGNPQYGVNNFIDQGDGTILDLATGLMWMKEDNQIPISWEQALYYAENHIFANYSDWRLPDTKELQSIVDYTRSPATTNSAAINPMFSSSSITDEGGNLNFPCYWTSTTHMADGPVLGSAACYVCFGEALGYLESPPASGNYTLTDVHGAGAQRSDFKTGDPADYPYGHGPQGDVVRINHYTRLVRGSSLGIDSFNDHDWADCNLYPQPASESLTIELKTTTELTAQIVNFAGQIVKEFSIDGSQTQVDVSCLPNGFYFLKVSSDKKIVSKKFAISR